MNSACGGLLFSEFEAVATRPPAPGWLVLYSISVCCVLVGLVSLSLSHELKKRRRDSQASKAVPGSSDDQISGGGTVAAASASASSAHVHDMSSVSCASGSEIEDVAGTTSAAAAMGPLIMMRHISTSSCVESPVAVTNKRSMSRLTQEPVRRSVSAANINSAQLKCEQERQRTSQDRQHRSSHGHICTRKQDSVHLQSTLSLHPSAPRRTSGIRVDSAQLHPHSHRGALQSNNADAASSHETCSSTACCDGTPRANRSEPDLLEYIADGKGQAKLVAVERATGHSTHSKGRPLTQQPRQKRRRKQRPPSGSSMAPTAAPAEAVSGHIRLHTASDLREQPATYDS